jgi:signal transduction histidine kinase
VEVIFQEKDDMLEFTIIDNGEGLTSDRVDMARKNLGLARMVDYAELLKGKLRVFSDLQKGTQVTLSVPYEIL